MADASTSSPSHNPDFLLRLVRMHTESKTPRAPLRVGIVGVGGVAAWAHLPAWQKSSLGRLVAFCETRKEHAETVAREHKIDHVFTDFDEFLARADVDAVDICTPNRFHAPMICAALAAGKHVLCEKPLAMNAAEIETIIAAAKKSGKKLMTAQHMRFSPEAQAVKKYAESGALGEVYYARAWTLRRRLAPSRDSFIQKKIAGGGALIDMGVHILDLTLWLLNFPKPVSVSGIALTKLGKRRDIRGGWGEWDRDKFDVDDFAAAFVRFENGLALSLECSWLLNYRERDTMRATLFGTQAGIEWPSCEFFTEQNGQLMDGKLVELPKINAYEAEIRAFCDCVLNDLPSPVPPEQSLLTAKIIDAIYRSQESGKEVAM
jgi:predicted dehydrogenase